MDVQEVQEVQEVDYTEYFTLIIENQEKTLEYLEYQKVYFEWNLGFFVVNVTLLVLILISVFVANIRGD